MVQRLVISADSRSLDFVYLAYNGKQPGDPLKGVDVVVDVVRGEASAVGKEFLPVLALGSDCYGVVKCESEATLLALEEWKDVTTSTDFV